MSPVPRGAPTRAQQCRRSEAGPLPRPAVTLLPAQPEVPSTSTARALAHGQLQRPPGPFPQSCLASSPHLPQLAPNASSSPRCRGSGPRTPFAGGSQPSALPHTGPPAAGRPQPAAACCGARGQPSSVSVTAPPPRGPVVGTVATVATSRDAHPCPLPPEQPGEAAARGGLRRAPWALGGWQATE